MAPPWLLSQSRPPQFPAPRPPERPQPGSCHFLHTSLLRVYGESRQSRPSLISGSTATGQAPWRRRRRVSLLVLPNQTKSNFRLFFLRNIARNACNCKYLGASCTMTPNSSGNRPKSGTENRAGKRPSFWGAPEGNAESAIQAVLIRIVENAYFDRRWPLNGFLDHILQETL